VQLSAGRSALFIPSALFPPLILEVKARLLRFIGEQEGKVAGLVGRLASSGVFVSHCAAFWEGQNVEFAGGGPSSISLLYKG
jgi:hypothetical protein